MQIEGRHFEVISPGLKGHLSTQTTARSDQARLTARTGFLYSIGGKERSGHPVSHLVRRLNISVVSRIRKPGFFKNLRATINRRHTKPLSEKNFGKHLGITNRRLNHETFHAGDKRPRN